MDRELDRAHAGQGFETIEVGVEQDPGIADNRRRRSGRAQFLIAPRDFAVVEVAGVKADAFAGVHLQPDGADDERAQDAHEDSTPWLRWDVPRGNRLSLTGPVGRG